MFHFRQTPAQVQGVTLRIYALKSYSNRNKRNNAVFMGGSVHFPKRNSEALFRVKNSHNPQCLRGLYRLFRVLRSFEAGNGKMPHSSSLLDSLLRFRSQCESGVT